MKCCACAKRSCAAKIPVFISFVFFWSGIIRREHDEFKMPQAKVMKRFKVKYQIFFSP